MGAKEDFFATLPSDSFSRDEEQLREALMEFLQKWRQPESPTVTVASRHMMVSTYQDKVIPKDAPVTLADWIERRIGGEVELGPGANGAMHFALHGQLQLPQKRPQPKGPPGPP